MGEELEIYRLKACVLVACYVNTKKQYVRFLLGEDE